MILHAFACTNYSYFKAKTFTLNTLSVAVIYFNGRQKLLPIDLDRHNSGGSRLSDQGWVWGGGGGGRHPDPEISGGGGLKKKYCSARKHS